MRVVYKVFRRRRGILLIAAALPLTQIFTGCFPNIPGIPNVSGAVLTSVQNLIISSVLNVISVVASNLLHL